LGARGISRKAGWWVLPLIALVIVGLDQLAKYLVVSNLSLYESWAPIPALEGWVDVHYVTNTGAAFGLFQDGGLFFIIIALVVSAVILFYYRFLPDGQWWVRLSLGNLIDRLFVGHVIDFIDLHVWPVFNVADSAIVCGVLLLAFLLLQEDRAESRRAKIADGSEGASG
jgi:signal peptidase II